MAIYKCKMCGGTLEIQENQTVAICEYCRTQQTLPKLNDEHKANLYDRANHFRRNNEYDKAMAIYEQILVEDTADAETYWSLVLCKYGIEYVEDPVTRAMVPTVNRAQFTSIFADENYQSAIEHADYSQKTIYEEEARKIDNIQKEILEISSKEEPFDVFICYKESDENGRRTQDSVLAQDIYYQLTQNGYKVFFSRITLESKLGQEYEPYIFAALNSAKVMIVVGTKPEYFNAVWVKNEWSRFLKIMQQDKNRIIIPAYRGMDPYDLPDALSYYQAQDMSKIGFIQDLTRGIEKIVSAGNVKNVSDITAVKVESSLNIDMLIKRGTFALEDKEWDKAFSFFDQALNLDAECYQAYLGQALANWRVSSFEEYAKGRLQETQNPKPTKHELEIAQETCQEIKNAIEQNQLDIDFLKTTKGVIIYYTEEENRVIQYESEKAKLDNDKFFSKSIRFAKDHYLNEQMQNELFLKLENRIDAAKENDEVEYKNALKRLDEAREIVDNILSKISELFTFEENIKRHKEQLNKYTEVLGKKEETMESKKNILTIGYTLFFISFVMLLLLINSEMSLSNLSGVCIFIIIIIVSLFMIYKGIMLKKSPLADEINNTSQEIEYLIQNIEQDKFELNRKVLEIKGRIKRFETDICAH